MPILEITTSFTGEIGVLPARVSILTNDTEATILTTGYLNKSVQNGTSFPVPCLAEVTTKASSASDYQVGWYQVAHVGTNWSLIAIGSPGDVTLPTVANQIPIFTNTTGTLADSGILYTSLILNSVASGQTIAASSSSATPGTIRALTGAMTESNTTMTSGNVVGLRGSVTNVGASGGFIYGAQGKVISTGTLSGSSWTAGVFGQFDISGATVNAGQMAAIWGDYGTSSGTMTDTTGMRGIAMTNTTAAVLNAQDYRYGNATYLQELAGAGGTLNYYLSAGTSAGSAGDAAHCAAQKVIKILINGVAAYIPVFTQNS